MTDRPCNGHTLCVKCGEMGECGEVERLREALEVLTKVDWTTTSTDYIFFIAKKALAGTEAPQ